MKSIGSTVLAVKDGSEALRLVAHRVGHWQDDALGGSRYPPRWVAALEECGRAFVEQVAEIVESCKGTLPKFTPRILGCAVRLAEALGTTGPLLVAFDNELLVLKERLEHFEGLYIAARRRLEEVSEEYSALGAQVVEISRVAELEKAKHQELRSALQASERRCANFEKKIVELRRDLNARPRARQRRGETPDLEGCSAFSWEEQTSHGGTPVSEVHAGDLRDKRQEPSAHQSKVVISSAHAAMAPTSAVPPRALMFGAENTAEPAPAPRHRVSFDATATGSQSTPIAPLSPRSASDNNRPPSRAYGMCPTAGGAPPQLAPQVASHPAALQQWSGAAFAAKSTVASRSPQQFSPSVDETDAVSEHLAQTASSSCERPSCFDFDAARASLRARQAVANLHTKQLVVQLAPTPETFSSPRDPGDNELRRHTFSGYSSVAAEPALTHAWRNHNGHGSHLDGEATGCYAGHDREKATDEGSADEDYYFDVGNTGSATRPLQLGSMWVRALPRSSPLSSSATAAFMHLAALGRQARELHPSLASPRVDDGDAAYGGTFGVSNEVPRPPPLNTSPAEGLVWVAARMSQWADHELARYDRALSASIHSASENLCKLAGLCSTNGRGGCYVLE